MWDVKQQNDVRFVRKFLAGVYWLRTGVGWYLEMGEGLVVPDAVVIVTWQWL